MKNLLLGLCLVVPVCASAQQVAKGLTASNGTYIGFYEYKPTNYDASPTIKYPLIIFLHGMGERGNGTTELSRVTANGIARYIKDGDPMTFTWNGKTETFLVLSPQLSNNYGWWQPFYIQEMINYAKQNLRIDTNRIILTGLSLGGGGVWNYSASGTTYEPKSLAAITPVCPTCESYNWCNISNANLPTWAFHAQDDPTTQANCTASIINTINNCNGPVKCYFTLWPTGGHGIWDRAYDRAYNYQNPNVYEWWLAQNKGLPANIRPKANAGSNLTISSSPGSATLSAAGSSDVDGTLVRYIWRKISGPAGGGVQTPVSTNGRTVVSALTPGIYQFEVKAVDDRADYSLDTVSVTVVASPVGNISPVTLAGSDVNTEYPTVNLDGSNSYDPDGTVVNYNWTKISGPSTFTISNSAIANPSVDVLLGTYAFELRTTDNMGAASRDTVLINSTGLPLGVNLRYFKASNTDGGIQLSWVTEREIGNDHFVIERSDDGSNFVAIGNIEGQQQSTTLREYSLTDDRPASGTVYYRIRQVSIDGKSSYLQTVTISSHGFGRGGIYYFPNPVRNSFTVQVYEKQTGLMKINLYSLDGRLVKQKQLLKQYEHISTPLDVRELGNGVYLLEVVIDDKLREVKKVIKQ